MMMMMMMMMIVDYPLSFDAVTLLVGSCDP